MKILGWNFHYNDFEKVLKEIHFNMGFKYTDKSEKEIKDLLLHVFNPNYSVTVTVAKNKNDLEKLQAVAEYGLNEIRRVQADLSWKSWATYHWKKILGFGIGATAIWHYFSKENKGLTLEEKVNFNNK